MDKTDLGNSFIHLTNVAIQKVDNITPARRSGLHATNTAEHATSQRNSQLAFARGICPASICKTRTETI